jgi:hypothetical protein
VSSPRIHKNKTVDQVSARDMNENKKSSEGGGCDCGALTILQEAVDDKETARLSYHTILVLRPLHTPALVALEREVVVPHRHDYLPLESISVRP